MGIQIQNLTNQARVLPAQFNYTLKPFESRIFSGSTIPQTLAEWIQ